MNFAMELSLSVLDVIIGASLRDLEVITLRAPELSDRECMPLQRR